MNPKNEKLLKKAYDDYVRLMLYDFPLEKIGDLVAEDVSGYGTTIDEKILEIERLRKIVRDQREQAAGIDMHIEMTPVHRRHSPDEITAIFMDEFEISMLIDGSKNIIPLRLTSVFEFLKTHWKLVHLHASKAVDTENDTWHLDEWKQKNEELQRLVDVKTADLKTKNRELEIEAALERVRTVTMSMQKPDDLLEVCQIISDQLLELHLSNIRNVQVAIIDKSEKKYANYQYFAAYSEAVFEETEYEANPAALGMVLEMEKSTNSFFIGSIKKRELSEFKEWRKKHHQYPDPLLDKLNEVFYYFYSIGEGGLGLTTYKAIDENELEIFKRFHLVFKMAYRRFIDIQQAGAQAREAQLELALERIRAQVTAMQESAELLDIVVNMRREFVALGHEAHYFWYMRYMPQKYEKAMTSGDGTRIGMVMTLPRHIHGDIKLVADWEKGDEATLVFPMDVETAVDYVHKMITLGDFKQVDPNAPSLEDIRHIGGLTFIMARTQHGEIGFSLPGYVSDPPREDLDTLVRFAAVFDLAYRRFEDLKSAERQNRETQIELALERVRSKAMAMHSSEDLGITVDTFFSELKGLNVSPHRCGVGIVDGESQIVNIQAIDTNPEQETKKIVGDLKLAGHPVLDEIFKHWQSQEEYFPVLRGNEILDYYKVMNPQIAFHDFADDEVQYGYYFYFKEGGVYAWTDVELQEQDLQIFRKYTSVLSLTYRRYLDLKDAEAKTREAIKQSSLDRIRGKIASMRNTSDLEQITPLIWNELKALEVPFFRCGVFIVDDQKDHIQVYLSTPEGKSIGSLDLDFEMSALTRNTVDSWRKNEVYQTHWNKEEFSAWTREMMKRRQIEKPEVYQDAEEPPESLYLHFIPFAQGMLYVGNTEQLNTIKIDLVKSLAEAFSFAYGRYEDFVVLEEAKERVENALSDLKATQSQLVHAEKMASLGELTAGIAHEIQNPLNFVNNFSEVSTDLIEEMKEEMQHGSKEEVNAILDDLLQNLEKINHHGKRADGIVKGMLQHSRSGSGKKTPTDIRALADEYLRLSYHGLRARDKSFNASFRLESRDKLPEIKLVGQDIGRVLLNLINNAFFAVNEKSKEKIKEYKPEVVVSISKSFLQEGKGIVEIRVKDNGKGIPENIKDKIFQPFFTTKATGEGTGLGLSMSYDIITKGHGGKLRADSVIGQGTEFIVELPIN